MPGFVSAILLKYTGDITTINCNKKINIDTPQQKHFIGIKNKGDGEIGQIGSIMGEILDQHDVALEEQGSLVANTDQQFNDLKNRVQKL